MDPGTVGMRLASSVLGPLVRKLFVLGEGPGAGVVDKPIRISGYVSFRGEKRSLGPADVRRLAGRIVQHALRTAGERPVAADEEQAVVDALAATLCALGELRITDLDAVRLGAPDFARALRRAADPDPARELGADAAYFYERLLDAACLHILHFFTQRSTFVAHTLVEQTRATAELTAKVDELIRRRPLPGAEDAGFEQEYLRYVTKKHGRLTIYGIDLNRSSARWPLDVAYLSLEATSHAPAEAGDPPEKAHLRAPQPADQILARGRRVLLRGEAGSGKSTLVQWLAVSAADQDPPPAMAYLQDRIPFVLPLRTVTRNGDRLPAPKDFLAAVDCPLAGSQPTGWEQRVLAAGRGLVLVDGIDEVPERERERTRRWLRDLMDTYDGDNRWLVTSRPSAVGERWLERDGFGELTLSAMGTAEVATFVRRWHAAARPDAEDPAELDAYEEQLLAAVRTKPDLGRLATNPLMCGLICALHRDRRGYLPHGRKDLYEAALSMLLSRRDRERDIEVPELGEDAQLDVLQRLAYWLIKNGRTEMDRSRAEDIIARALPAVPELAALGDAAAVFDHFLLRSGLLRQPAPDAVHFVHKTFQDFLGARAAVEEGDFGLLTGHARDDQWVDVIRMAVALANKRERAEIFRGLLAVADPRADLLAAVCLEQATVLDPAVRELVRERAAGLIPPGNADEARALAEAGPLILELLPGPDEVHPVGALFVVTAATHVASDAALPFLRRYARHPHLQVRSQLMWAWSRFDPVLYGQEVIAELDPSGLDYTVRDSAQLALLRGLPEPPAALDVRPGVPFSDVLAYDAGTGAGITSLVLTDPEPSALASLARLPRLARLDLRSCSGRTDLSPVGALPLESLSLHGTPDLRSRPIGPMPTLRTLHAAFETGSAWDVRSLPAGPDLRTLAVGGESMPAGGLAGLRELTSLESLDLAFWCGPRSGADWREIAALPRLRELTLEEASFTWPADVVLGAVTTLQVWGDPDEPMQHIVDGLPQLCPRLRELYLDGAVDLDLAPLAGLTDLASVTVPVPAYVLGGIEALPDHVTLRTL
ncbi:NACHT domain-containing protein [Streptomyces antimicrobicus]|uniref:NACHT domain-containing protein n=1 Tax=Streptomyces antimicrobicus TaxID=2883108 RepID=A0ABS8B556_9ACTN|nr:NACHT domain-containing protein [Streptomyces antimicrobicus]MCB5179723.1 NACHT domain-containing protein [Streptomyces antimicrobicus]